MRFVLGLLLIGLAGPALGQDAPFCVIAGYGSPPQCWHYNASSCQSAARSVNGMCVARASLPSTQASAPQSNFAESFARGQAEGQRRRLEREQHEAQLRLLEAQTAEINARMAPPPPPSPPPSTGLVLYRCPQPDGVPFYTATAAIGCVVVGIKK